MNRTVDTNAQSVRHLENLHGRHGADAGVILVQVDQLARINHSAGTETGNALLDEVARRLETFAADEFGHGSFVGRLEGPRFLIVPAVPLSLGALRAQERALHVALAEPMVGDPNGRLAIRIVTALITRDEPVEEQLRAAADQLARPASARDGVMVKSALANDEVAIFYQPQYEVATGAMIGVEALLRWQHPELGLLGAGPLVTAARAARMERELTEHAHRVALTEIAGWPRALGKLRSRRILYAKIRFAIVDLPARAVDHAERARCLVQRHFVVSVGVDELLGVVDELACGALGAEPELLRERADRCFANARSLEAIDVRLHARRVDEFRRNDDIGHR